MKTYLRLSAVIFLLAGITHTLKAVYGYEFSLNTGGGDILMPMEASLVAAPVCYLLFLFGFGLSFTVGRRERQMQAREKELSSLIVILQDGRKQQMALLEMLQIQAPIPEPTEPSESEPQPSEDVST